MHYSSVKRPFLSPCPQHLSSNNPLVFVFSGFRFSRMITRFVRPSSHRLFLTTTAVHTVAVRATGKYLSGSFYNCFCWCAVADPRSLWMPRCVSQIFASCGLSLLGRRGADPALNLSGKFALRCNVKSNMWISTIRLVHKCWSRINAWDWWRKVLRAICLSGWLIQLGGDNGVHAHTMLHTFHSTLLPQAWRWHLIQVLHHKMHPANKPQVLSVGPEYAACPQRLWGVTAPYCSERNHKAPYQQDGISFMKTTLYVQPGWCLVHTTLRMYCKPSNLTFRQNAADTKTSTQTTNWRGDSVSLVISTSFLMKSSCSF